MMHPWDREQNYREVERGSCGLAWLFPLIIAIGGMIGLARLGANRLVLIPLAISVFFMLIYLMRYRHEVRRQARMDAAFEDEVRRAREAQAKTISAPPNPAGMRMIFDRFDLLAIRRARRDGLDPKGTAGFLDFARGYVDTAHADTLLANHDEAELRRHLRAALERAALAYEMHDF